MAIRWYGISPGVIVMAGMVQNTHTWVGRWPLHTPTPSVLIWDQIETAWHLVEDVWEAWR